MSDDARGYEEVVVRRAGDLGRTLDSELPTLSGVKARGWGTDLKSPAWDEIRVRLEAHGVDVADLEPQTHVATIRYDLEAWTYTIEYELEALQLSTHQRIFQRLATAIGRTSP